MSTPNKPDLPKMKMVFAVILLAAPVLCLTGLIIYRHVDVDVTISTRRFGTADDPSFHSAIHIAVVMCGNILDEGFIILKSAVIFSQSNLVMHVFTEEDLKQAVKDKIANWTLYQKNRLKLVIHDIEFPETPGCQNCTPELWKSLFSPCSAQRLFFPELMRDVDSVIYLDTDALFLAPVEEAWKQFTKFGPRHIFGIAPNLDQWYSKSPVPHCSSGLNAGVLFMNLTRMRESNWFASIQEHFQKYRKILVLFDQDLINIYCSLNPGVVYEMECIWNHRGRFCETHNHCNDTTGVNILHALNGMSHDVKNWPQLVLMYNAFQEHDFSKHNTKDLYERIVNRIKPFSKTKCGERSHIFTRHLQQYILNKN